MNSFKTVLLCFCQNLLRNVYARCSLALLISYKKEYNHTPKSTGELEICVFFISYYLELFYKGLIKFNIY